ncbi:type I pullulanase [Virgibacillus profundi]|uniref:Type I pullulanase n=1 Tax=Virgibacillus profundi TaxID=2024555 RepID=A0A2A2IHK2_9BACI|nr:type I pullulanase [Virgibacillus profundi]PAV30796.1 type I pullulanase [Virgibacillus profundi]PXY54979.1 type I pullulanase [Virgibacillus profundi]
MVAQVAWIDDVHVLTAFINNHSLLQAKENDPVIYWKSKEKYFEAKVEKVINDATVTITFTEDLPMGEELTLLWGEERIPVYPGAVVRTSWFDNHYAALHTTFGASYEKKATTFTIWAPTANSVKVSIGKNLLLLDKQKNGVWKLKVNGDWHGCAYEYEVTINGKTERVNDPYAKSMLANSEKSVVIDFSRTDQSGEASARPRLTNLQDAIIYELHVRDATIKKDSGVKNRGKFLGLTETGTTTPNGFSTALSYIKELGCTHVQLLPINDFARVNELHPENDYNWGYDPLYFQVPEGSYSTAAEDPLARINECKQMIGNFHREGISVILDVVYNHVFIMEESPFEKIVPGYYFRYHTDGNLSNGTGVGNDLATERKMVRKFILDTIDLWLKEYNVDGFRFDLMGIMDVRTMQEIQERCKKEAVPIMLLGEGWDLPTALASDKKATSSQSHQLPGIRFFNDYFRNSLKGDQFANGVGYVNGKGHFIERLPSLVSGSALEEYGEPFVSDVNQTINYVECHDNHTLWDRLLLTNREEKETNRKKMHQLATGITLLSQGVPFIHAGQEWFRSKQGDENSYLSGDQINQLDWQKRELENDPIEFIKELIALRKKYDVFRLSSKQEIRKRLHILDTIDPVFGFVLLGDKVDFAIYTNPTHKQVSLQLPSTGKWQVIARNTVVSGNTVQQEVNGEFTLIEGYELVVFRKNRW